MVCAGAVAGRNECCCQTRMARAVTRHAKDECEAEGDGVMESKEAM